MQIFENDATTTTTERTMRSMMNNEKVCMIMRCKGRWIGKMPTSAGKLQLKNGEKKRNADYAKRMKTRVICRARKKVLSGGMNDERRKDIKIPSTRHLYAIPK